MKGNKIQKKGKLIESFLNDFIVFKMKYCALLVTQILSIDMTFLREFFLPTKERRNLHIAIEVCIYYLFQEYKLLI